MRGIALLIESMTKLVGAIGFTRTLLLVLIGTLIGALAMTRYELLEAATDHAAKAALAQTVTDARETENAALLRELLAVSRETCINGARDQAGISRCVNPPVRP